MAHQLDNGVRILKAAADPTRLRLLALCHLGESSVSDLVGVLGQSQPRISRHLRLLCEAGLLERFRDGHWIYYRTPTAGPRAADVRRVLEFLPADTDELVRDAELAIASRRDSVAAAPPALDEAERALHRAVLDTVLTAPVGRLLDIGSGNARMLKLLGRRATRAIGVDIDADRRQQARAELAVAGLGNCSIRAGDAHRLEFADCAFDTVILDEVLTGADSPDRVMTEAARVLADSGRLLVIDSLAGRSPATAGRKTAASAAAAGLALGRPRAVPPEDPRWLVSVAILAGADERVA